MVTRMIGICAPQVQAREPRDEEEETQATQVQSFGVLPPQLFRNQELHNEFALNTSTEEDAKRMEEGEIEYHGMVFFCRLLNFFFFFLKFYFHI